MFDKIGNKAWFNSVIASTIIFAIIGFFYAKKILTLNKDVGYINTGLYIMIIFVALIVGVVVGSLIGFLFKIIAEKKSKDNLRI